MDVKHTSEWVKREIRETSLGDLVSRATEVSRCLTDGHYTLLRFTAGYKIAFGTVDLDTEGIGRGQVDRLPTWPNMRDAFVHLLLDRPHIGAPALYKDEDDRIEEEGMK